MIAGSTEGTHTVRLATAECDPEMVFLHTAATSLRYQAGDNCKFFPRQNLGLKYVTYIQQSALMQFA
jgi:hypothetical protein